MQALTGPNDAYFLKYTSFFDAYFKKYASKP